MTAADEVSISVADHHRTAPPCAGGDGVAWPLLVPRFEPTVAATVARFRLQDGEARVPQQTWLQLLDNRDQIRELRPSVPGC